MTKERAPYEVLGVSPTASPAEVAAAYRILAKACHPDHFHGRPEAVQREAEDRMKTLNEAYTAARAGCLGYVPDRHRLRAHPGPTADPEDGPGGRAFAGVPWTTAANERRSAAYRENQARKARERQAAQGHAVARPRAEQPFRNSVLSGLGLARVNDNVVCHGCKSVQWLPENWRQGLDDYAYFCSICDRVILARALGAVKAPEPEEKRREGRRLPRLPGTGRRALGTGS